MLPSVVVCVSSSRTVPSPFRLQYLDGALPSPPVDAIVDFYLAAREKATVSPLSVP